MDSSETPSSVACQVRLSCYKLCRGAAVYTQSGKVHLGEGVAFLGHKVLWLGVGGEGGLKQMQQG